MTTSNEEAPVVPNPDYDNDSDPQTSNRRPSNQTEILPVQVQKQLQDKMNGTASPSQIKAFPQNIIEEETQDAQTAKNGATPSTVVTQDAQTANKEATPTKVVTILSNDPNIQIRVLPDENQPTDESSTKIRPAAETEAQGQSLETDVNGNEDSSVNGASIVEQPLRVSSGPAAVDKLTEDFGQLLEAEIDTDVTIQVGRHTFPAHRLILKARCPELLRTARAAVPLMPPPVPSVSDASSTSSCCSGPSKQKERSAKRQQQKQQEEPKKPVEPQLLSYVIELPSPPFTEDLVRGLLRYIYTSRIEVLAGIVEELLVVAGDHRLFELKARLECHLWENLVDDNCLRLLVFADKERNQWDCRKLKRRALKYIKDRIELIILREEFKNLKNGHCKLLEEVLRAVVFGDDWIEGATQNSTAIGY
ncbi:uncharacterized protein LOC107980847 [Nasonia vitripennis]|uniref:BTB domain-containing protein n=1 Tax=Nasonia vitripennis TaxID=7425 RepID=A0A7M7IW15_NASVI|nr:uncharacterized protein LOC107980847 [Nasonia vitripennis]